MLALHHFTQLMADRAAVLVITLALCPFVGEFLLHRTTTYLGHRLVALERKLNRTKRGIATLVYRGIVALTVVIIPALVVGIILAQPTHWGPPLQAVILIAIFGQVLAMPAMLRLRRATLHNELLLAMPGRSFLFPDTHAGIRFAVLSRSRAFAIGIVGGSFWYLLADTGGMFTYLAVAAAHRAFPSQAFGWAARALFQLLDAVPYVLARLLFLLAALFTSGTKPFTALTARNWQGFMAALTHLSIGGQTPHGNLPWLGTGTPKATPLHYRRFLQLLLVTLMLLILAYAAPQIRGLLIFRKETAVV